MPNGRNRPTGPRKTSSFFVEGRIQLEQPESLPGELKLAAYIFDKAGAFLGSADLDEQGNYRVAVRLSQPADVELVVGPSDMQKQIRQSSAYRKTLLTNEWKSEGNKFLVKHHAVLPHTLWRPWLPQRICVSGHVRKISQHDGNTDICPVPYVKVEIFDVDRENCFWPLVRKWWELLLDRPVIRILELLKEPPILIKPFPDPDPVPELNLTAISNLPSSIIASRLGPVSLGPQPEPPDTPSGTLTGSVSTTSILTETSAAALQPAFTRVGEARLLDSSIASRLEKLTLTSKTAPWFLFPNCFYSKAEVCETTTDCTGFFSCCFNWSSFHIRRGRLRFDSRPDIIIKVTQIIDGVTEAVYLDPYTSTRWNVNDAHIDLFLDNEEFICGSGNCYDPPAGSPVFFTHIGDDYVYNIDQTSGLYNDSQVRNVAYGGSLRIQGQLGEDLTSSTPIYYYRLSYAKTDSSEFIPITAPLSDTRVSIATRVSETRYLGPKTVNGVLALYEVRNLSDYMWYKQEELGIWYSSLTEADTGKYVLRLEIFDQNGTKITSAMGVDYLNGTVSPPNELPHMLDGCDLVITLDNKAPEVDLTIPDVRNECGVIPWTPSLVSINFHVKVSQENNRLNSWGLYYTKGTNPTGIPLDNGASNNGLLGSVDKDVPSKKIPPPPDMLADLNSTCAFALKLWAWAHVRDGRNWIYYNEQMKAIAVEKCSIA